MLWLVFLHRISNSLYHQQCLRVLVLFAPSKYTVVKLFNWIYKNGVLWLSYTFIYLVHISLVIFSMLKYCLNYFFVFVEIVQIQCLIRLLVFFLSHFYIRFLYITESRHFWHVLKILFVFLSFDFAAGDFLARTAHKKKTADQYFWWIQMPDS